MKIIEKSPVHLMSFYSPVYSTKKVEIKKKKNQKPFSIKIVHLPDFLINHRALTQRIQKVLKGGGN